MKQIPEDPPFFSGDKVSVIHEDGTILVHRVISCTLSPDYESGWGVRISPSMCQHCKTYKGFDKVDSHQCSMAEDLDPQRLFRQRLIWESSEEFMTIQDMIRALNSLPSIWHSAPIEIVRPPVRYTKESFVSYGQVTGAITLRAKEGICLEVHPKGQEPAGYLLEVLKAYSKNNYTTLRVATKEGIPIGGILSIETDYQPNRYVIYAIIAEEK